MLISSPRDGGIGVLEREREGTHHLCLIAQLTSLNSQILRDGLEGGMLQCVAEAVDQRIGPAELASDDDEGWVKHVADRGRRVADEAARVRECCDHSGLSRPRALEQISP